MVITWQQLRDAREYADLTQNELAEKLGVSPRTIVNWESENGGVPRKSEYKVERILGPAMRTVAALQAMPPIEETEPNYHVPDGLGGVRELTAGEYDEYLASQDANERFGIPDMGENARQRRRNAFSPFTDIDLLDELQERARARGIEASDWSARGVSKLNVTPDLHTMHIDELSLAADENNKRPDEELRQP